LLFYFKGRGLVRLKDLTNELIETKNMSTNFLTNIDWTSPMTIGIGIGIIAVIAIAGYLVWAWQEKKPPFDNV
jgi:hypothetical protein